MSRRIARLVSAAVCSLVAAFAGAQPLQKSAVLVDPGNRKTAGETFAYRLAYNCSRTASPCLNAEVVDLLPPEVEFVATVPDPPTGDVAAINVTPDYLGSGRTRVQFVMVNPLPAGNSGDLLIDVRFPNDGFTPDGTVATNTADGVNLTEPAGTFTTPPVDVTAVARIKFRFDKALLNHPQSMPAYLDRPESYQLHIWTEVPTTGTLSLTSVGPLVDTLPPGTVFNGAAPAADCEPGCVGTAPGSVTWSSPCPVPLTLNNSCILQVNVTFPSANFASGATVTNRYTVTGTPAGQSSQIVGNGAVTHSLITFVASAGAGILKTHSFAEPRSLNRPFSYGLGLFGAGNVPLDDLVVVDTLPLQLELQSVSTGTYAGFADFAAGMGVRVSYEKNTAPGVFTLWGSSPDTATDTPLTVPPPGLGGGEYVTRVRWEYGQAAPGEGTGSVVPASVTGQVVNPDNAGNPVAVGDIIQNCAAMTAVYTAGATNVSGNSCDSFPLANPFVDLLPRKTAPTVPFNVGQAVVWELNPWIYPSSADPAPLDGLVLADLLPVDLQFVSWSASNLPTPQIFEQIENFAGTGRTLLRWRWTPGSGNLAIDQQLADILLTTTIRPGATFGPLANTFAVAANTPGLEQHCRVPESEQVDTLDLDGDGSTTDTLCTGTGTVLVAPLAQMVANEQIRAVCDGNFTSSSAGTLPGGDLAYRLHVQNASTVPMQSLVLIDLLPGAGDTGVRDTTPRGSQWTPFLAAPILSPPGTTLSYSTAANPCRGEVGGPTTACDPPNWTTVPPVPITSVRAFKVDFGSRVLGPFDSLDFLFHLTAPNTLPAAGVAYNSFAYQGARADGLGTLAAEPQKVGVGTGTCTGATLGDFVWNDANQDGLQNDGPTGMNGVAVRLFTPGPDGVRGTADDLELATAVTADGPAGRPGWYNFPGLAPGSYSVCVTPPPTFTFTTPHVGTGALDSDADPATGCSGVVTLAAGQNDPDVDFGLVATRLAALGDFVWFDRNGDGLQNESVWDGANGVTVKLFLDNGNGVPEPGMDTLVANTVTADDPFGRPGFYRFDGLTPGRAYFVQFLRPAGATAFTAAHAGNGTIDSDADPVTGISALVTLARGESNSTLDAGLLAATGPLTLGNQIWLDADNDGIFEPQNGEVGIDGVRLNLYLDADDDGRPTPDEYQGATFSATESGFAGRYRFSNLAPGRYIVVVDPSNFTGGGPLAGLISATGNDPAPDPDDGVDGDDNGALVGGLIASLPVTLTAGGAPISEDGDANTNLTVDFAFTPGVAPPAPPVEIPTLGTWGLLALAALLVLAARRRLRRGRGAESTCVIDKRPRPRYESMSHPSLHAEPE